MSTPLVSVILPVFNARRYLAEAMNSVLNQTLRDLEMVVVDDGSTDGSDQVMDEVAARDPRVRIVRRPNTGLVGALNDAIASARSTEFLARMDADDVCLPERLEKQVAFMQSHPDCVLLGTMVRAIDPCGVELWESERLLTHEELDKQLMLGRAGVIRHPAAIMRAAAVRQIGGYRKVFDNAEDSDLFLRLAEVGKVANLPDVLLLYRQHYGSINRMHFVDQKQKVTAAVYAAAQRRGVKMPEGWRYDPTPPLAIDTQIREWGWHALKHNRVDAARRHARELIRKKPLSVESWRLMLCALRGR